jgi:membrane associated rhomboid family serine protease
MPRQPRMAGSSMMGGTPRLTPGVKLLLFALVGTSLGTALLRQLTPAGATITDLIVLQPDRVLHGEVWRLLTYTFLQIEPFGLIFGALAMWWIGSPLEDVWGKRRLLTHYFLATGLAGVLTCLVGLASGAVREHAYLGTWAAQEALIGAFGTVLATTPIRLFFVLPVGGNTLILASAGITLLYVIMAGGPVPYLPHLFALGLGVLLARGSFDPRTLWLRLKVIWIERRMRSRKLRVVKDLEDQLGGPRSGDRGSDRYLH